jgi:hypothetical protein
VIDKIKHQNNFLVPYNEACRRIAVAIAFAGNKTDGGKEST